MSPVLLLVAFLLGEFACQRDIAELRSVDTPVFQDFWTQSYPERLSLETCTWTTPLFRPPELHGSSRKQEHDNRRREVEVLPFVKEHPLNTTLSQELVCPLIDDHLRHSSKNAELVSHSLINFTTQAELAGLEERAGKIEHEVSSNIKEILANIYNFAPSSTSVQSNLCRKHSSILLERLKSLDLWALKMIDSSAKVPSGLLNGNVNQFGDFDQCVAVSADVGDGHTILGKYCLASLHLQMSGRLMEIGILLNSHSPVFSEFSDPGHRIAKSREIRWAVCVPTSCSAEDVQQQLSTSLESHNVSGVVVSARVDPQMCYTGEGAPISTGTVLTTFFFLNILALCLVATLYDRGEDAGQESTASKSTRLLLAFSFRKNVRALMSTKTAPDDIACVHGVRAMNAVALLVFHKSVALMFNPYVNRTALTESFSLPWSVVGRTAIIYTDSFILISGLLSSYIFVKELDKKGKISTLKKLTSRFIRITPNLLVVTLFCTYILVHLGSGPQWNLVVKHHADICQRYMWRNFLYIHNFYDFENMCLTHTHQLGMDMQLFAVTPFLVGILWCNPRGGTALLLSIGVASTLLRYVVTYQQQLSTVIYFGASVSQMFRTANLSYIRASHRASVYLMGVALGFVLRRIGSKGVAFTKMQVVIGWTVALFMGLLAMAGPYRMTDMNYKYNPTVAALYNALSPVMWGAFLCWGILADVSSYGGYLGRFCRWRGFVVFTRLAYAVYLTQFPIFFYNVGVTRSAEYYTPLMMFNIGEIVCVLLASVILTLMVDLPCQTARKIIWNENGEDKNQKEQHNTAPFNCAFLQTKMTSPLNQRHRA